MQCKLQQLCFSHILEDFLLSFSKYGFINREILGLIARVSLNKNILKQFERQMLKMTLNNFSYLFCFIFDWDQILFCFSVLAEVLVESVCKEGHGVLVLGK